MHMAEQAAQKTALAVAQAPRTSKNATHLYQQSFISMCSGWKGAEPGPIVAHWEKRASRWTAQGGRRNPPF
jgi:hypothetical protein